MPVPALTARRLCQLAPCLSRRRLLPYIQTANRSDASSTKGKREGGPPPAFKRISRAPFNPFKAGREFPRAFEDILSQRLATVRHDLSQPKFVQSLHLTREAFDAEWATFERAVHNWVKRATPEAYFLAEERARAVQKTDQKLRQLFYVHLFGDKFTSAEIDNQKALANLRYPAEWYPATRQMPRTVHMHVGPTNSGKTYHALKRLEEADSGIYLGPLRLLAHEVYTRLNAKGKLCALVTGEEQRVPDGETKMWSCTVEMAPLNQALEVAVIDEIQMISHKERGWAWTAAFLGLQAREIHVCGEARTVPLMRELCALVGDKVEVHEYERLTPLKVADNSLKGNLRDNLQKGDCIVSFSVLGIHALRKAIENATGRKCAIVYGGLPPETRAQQAKLFNDPDNEYDFLVASDAIGMGLNLSIKRVIFESTMKNNGSDFVPLQISEVKQIAGRAGRYKSAHEAVTKDQAPESNVELTQDAATAPLSAAKGEYSSRPPKEANPTVGIATTLEHFDYPYLARCMEAEPEPITTAGLFPPPLVIERFANYFPPGTPFSYILLRLHEISDLHPRFHLCALKDQLAIADVIHTVTSLSIQERIVICAAPTNVRDAEERKCLYAMAKCIADNESGDLLDLPIALEVLDSKPSAERKYLYSLEQLHKSLVLYLWLSYRFPNVFTTRNLANYAKKLVEDAIEKTLSEFSFTQRKLDAIKKKREKAMKQIEQEESREMEGQNKGDKSGSALAEMIQEGTRTDDVDEYPLPELDMDVGEDASAEQLEPEWRPSSRHIDVGVGRTEDLPQSRV